MDFLPGIKTLSGLAIMVFGTLAGMYEWAWWTQIAGEVEALVNQLLQLGGTAIALYGTVMKIRREKKLKADLAAKGAA